MNQPNTPANKSMKRAQAYLRAYLRERPQAVKKIALFTACVMSAEQRVNAGV